MKRLLSLLLASLLLVGAVVGCSPSQKDEADANYKGPGKSKPGAPSANPTDQPIEKK